MSEQRKRYAATIDALAQVLVDLEQAANVLRAIDAVWVGTEMNRYPRNIKLLVEEMQAQRGAITVLQTSVSIAQQAFSLASEKPDPEEEHVCV